MGVQPRMEKAAIREGRGMFDRIMKMCLFIKSGTKIKHYVGIILVEAEEGDVIVVHRRFNRQF